MATRRRRIGPLLALALALFAAAGLLATSLGASMPRAAAGGLVPVPGPTVTGVDPNSGPTSGGTTVTVTGTEFCSPQVDFGGTAATGVDVTSDTSLTAVSPPGSGTEDVTVFSNCLTEYGESSTSPADDFTYIVPSPPTITSVTPSSGPTAGGTSVTIQGTNLANLCDPCHVRFGPNYSTDVSFQQPPGQSPYIVAVSPPGPAGTVGVYVSGDCFEGCDWAATSSADDFTYMVPPISSVTVAVSDATAGATATYTIGFVTGSTLTTPWSITVQAPSGTAFPSAGAGYVLTDPSQEEHIVGQLGTPTGSTLTVNVAGGLNAGAGDTLQLVIAGVTNPSAGTYNASLSTSAQPSPVQSTSYQIIAPPSPTVTSVSPSSGGAAGGTPVTIEGTNLTGACAVTFGGNNAANFSVEEPSGPAPYIVATSPPGTPGPVDVVVSTQCSGNELHSAITPADQFTYVAPPISSVTVAVSNPTAGVSATYTISFTTGSALNAPWSMTVQLPTGTVLPSAGTNYTLSDTTGGFQVVGQLASANGSSLTVDILQGFDASAGDTLVLTIPGITNPTAGTYTISLSTSAQPSSVGSNSYQIVAPPAPTVTSVTPDFGPLVGGTSVRIQGANLDGACAVTFGGNTATFSPQQPPGQPPYIVATSPAGSGTVDVVVATQCSGGSNQLQSATSPADRFTYVLPVTSTDTTTSTTTTSSTTSTTTTTTTTTTVPTTAPPTTARPTTTHPRTTTGTTTTSTTTVPATTTRPLTTTDTTTATTARTTTTTARTTTTTARTTTTKPAQTTTTTKPGRTTTTVRRAQTTTTTAPRSTTTTTTPRSTTTTTTGRPGRTTTTTTPRSTTTTTRPRTTTDTTTATTARTTTTKPAQTTTTSKPGRTTTTVRPGRTTTRTTPRSTTTTTRSRSTTTTTAVRTKGRRGKAKRAKVLVPTLQLNPSMGPPGTIVDVTGRGFPRAKRVEIFWSLSTGATVVRTNRDGNLSATLTVLVPDVIGPRAARAKGYRAEASFLVVPSSSQPGGSDADPIYRTEGP